MQMGAALATGIDIDPQAITSASENLILNGLHSNQMPVFLVPMNAQPSSFRNAVDKSEENKLINNPDLKSSRGTYDVVAANILLNPLLELVEDIVGYAKPGGVVAISGILEEQVKEFNIIFLTFSCLPLPEFICLFICFFCTFCLIIQVPKVKDVYSSYLDSISVSEMDGWACLQGMRRV